MRDKVLIITTDAAVRGALAREEAELTLMGEAFVFSDGTAVSADRVLGDFSAEEKTLRSYFVNDVEAAPRMVEPQIGPNNRKARRAAKSRRR